MSQPQERVSVGLQKQLMVDDYIIAEKENVTRELDKVTKCGIVLEPSLPTDFLPPPGSRGSRDYERNLKSGRKPDGSGIALDFGFYTTVLWNEKDEKFQMWYMPWRLAGVGYAESTDGIHWTRPLVGKDGKDNIVHLSQSFSCMIDPTVPWGHPEKDVLDFYIGTSRDMKLQVPIRLWPSGSPRQVPENVKRMIDILGCGGGLILAPCHVLQTDVPTENVCTMYKTGHEYGPCDDNT